jgi:hypothetical protein
MSVTVTYSNKLDRIQKLQSLSTAVFFFLQNIQYWNDNLSEELNVKAVHSGYHHTKTSFLMNGYHEVGCCHSVPEAVAICVFSVST